MIFDFPNLNLTNLYLTNKSQLNRYYNPRIRRRYNLLVNNIDRVVYWLIGTAAL